MVRTRSSKSTTKTPSPGPLPARTRKRKSVVVSSESQDDKSTPAKPQKHDKLTSRLKEKTQSEEQILEKATSGRTETEEDVLPEDEMGETGDPGDDGGGEPGRTGEEVTCIEETDLDENQDESDQADEANSKSDAEDEEDEETNLDDEPPEDVSFQQSRHSALNQLSQVLEQTKQKKIELKEKRKAREELFTQQKKRKYETARLSEDFIKDVEQEEEMAKEEDILRTKEPDRTHTHFDESEDEDDDDSREKVDGLNEKFGIEVVTLPKLIQKPTAKADAALQFLKSRLYGTNVKRQTANDLHANVQKKKGKPAFKFVKEKASTNKKTKKKKSQPKKDRRTWSSMT